MLTADTITDEEIRELREHCSENGEGCSVGEDYYPVAEMLNMCDEALRDFDYGDTFASMSLANSLSLVDKRVKWARARCAEILNARTTKEP
jgi:hypothetical protein